MDKISIIIPAYNSENYIARCIESVINQSYSNLEIIIINDGSKDKSMSILKKYEKKDSRIILIDQKNKGVALTRNRGIEVASGKYLMFIDNDDYIDLDYIKEMHSAIENSDIVIGGYKRVNDNKILFKKNIKNIKFGIYENVAPWGKLIKREFLIRNDIKFYNYSIGEDIIFNLKLYSSTNKIVISKSTGYNWYYNSISVSNTSQKSFNENILNLYNEMIKYENNACSRYFIGRYHIWYLLFSGKNSKSKDFYKEYLKIMKWHRKNNFHNSISFIKILKNETSIKNKIIVFIFYLIEKVRLVKIFSKIYCRG